MKIISAVFVINALLLIEPMEIFAQQYGCTDPLATNFDSNAMYNDGSCVYNPANITPVNSFVLSDTIDETSGLIMWDGYLWTHNDDTDLNIYALDTTNGQITDYLTVEGVVNIDWEEIAHDEQYIYIGDFGNNVNGNRTNLQILRVEKYSLISGSPVIDSIRFNYQDQNDFSPQGANNTEFDCEAMILTQDSIYLFTKDWVNEQTCVYRLPKHNGNFTAEKLFCHNIQGLITGATYLQDKNLIVLCGYSNLLQPFFYLLYDYNENNFFSGNKRKINISLPFHQVEAVKTTDGKKYFITNEYFLYSPIEVEQQLHILHLDEFLEHYLDLPTEIMIDECTSNNKIIVYPNPIINKEFILELNFDSQIIISITDLSGNIVYIKEPIFLQSGVHNFNLNESVFTSGLHILNIITEKENHVFKMNFAN